MPVDQQLLVLFSQSLALRLFCVILDQRLAIMQTVRAHTTIQYLHNYTVLEIYQLSALWVAWLAYWDIQTSTGIVIACSHSACRQHMGRLP